MTAEDVYQRPAGHLNSLENGYRANDPLVETLKTVGRLQATSRADGRCEHGCGKRLTPIEDETALRRPREGVFGTRLLSRQMLRRAKWETSTIR